MPKCKPRSGEDEDKFVSRCIGEMRHAGHEQEQSVAACYSIYRNARKEESQGRFPQTDDLHAKAWKEVSTMSKEEIAEIAKKYVEESAPPVASDPEVPGLGTEGVYGESPLQSGVFAGHYPGLDDVEVPENLKPRPFGSAPEDPELAKLKKP